MGVHYRLFDQFSSGFGFTGIAVALLAKNNPIGVIAAAILFGALSAGAGTMQLEAGVSQKVILDHPGASIIFLIGAETIVTWTVSKIPAGRREARCWLRCLTPELFASAFGWPPLSRWPRSARRSASAPVSSTSRMEGLMLICAFAGVAVALLTGNTWLGVIGAVMARWSSRRCTRGPRSTCVSDQVVSGTAINILALGVTGFLMETIFGRPGTTDPVRDHRAGLRLPEQVDDTLLGRSGRGSMSRS